MRDRQLQRLLLQLGNESVDVRLSGLWELTYRRLNRGRLSRRQRDRAMASIAALCRDPDARVRKAAVHAFMWHFGSANPTAMLVELALGDQEAEVRGQALEALAVRWASANPRSPGLVQVRRAIAGGLRSEEAVVRFWAVYAVGQLGLSEERDAVMALLADRTVAFADMTVADEARAAMEHLTQ